MTRDPNDRRQLTPETWQDRLRRVRALAVGLGYVGTRAIMTEFDLPSLPSATALHRSLVRHFGAAVPRLAPGVEIRFRDYAAELWQVAEIRGYIIPNDIFQLTSHTNLDKALRVFRKFDIALPELRDERPSFANRIDIPRPAVTEPEPERLPPAEPVRCDDHLPYLPPQSLEALSARREGGKVYYLLR